MNKNIGVEKRYIATSVMIFLFFVTPYIVNFIQPATAQTTGNISDSTISVSIKVNNTQDKTSMEDMERDDWPEKEIFAILGRLPLCEDNQVSGLLLIAEYLKAKYQI